jgi:hypothetical protein
MMRVRSLTQIQHLAMSVRSAIDLPETELNENLVAERLELGDKPLPILPLYPPREQENVFKIPVAKWSAWLYR